MAKTTTRGRTTRGSKATPSKKPSKATTAATRKTRATASAGDSEVAPAKRWKMIAEAAYRRAEQRGFGSGDPLDDWLSAEREVDSLLAKRTSHIAH